MPQGHGAWGASEGEALGIFVGAIVGISEGICVGVARGVPVGVFVGAAIGAVVGLATGAVVGRGVGGASHTQAPATEVQPAVHFAHVDSLSAPVPGEYVPAGHWLQEVLLGDKYVPQGQLVSVGAVVGSEEG